MNKPTPPPRQAALAAISALPDAASFEEIACRLHMLEAIRAGVENTEAVRTVSQAKARLAKWHVGRGGPTATSDRACQTLPSAYQ